MRWFWHALIPPFLSTQAPLGSSNGDGRELCSGVRQTILISQWEVRASFLPTLAKSLKIFSPLISGPTLYMHSVI